MNLVGLIARRYLFSKRNTNAINIISGISVAVFAIGSAVMLIVLSSLNGLEQLVIDLNNALSPDIQISAKHHKSFDPSSMKAELAQQAGIINISEVYQDNVVVRYGSGQEIAQVRGVDQYYDEVTGIDTSLAYGRYQLQHNAGYFAIFGGAIANNLNINISNEQTNAALYVPKHGVQYNPLNPDASLNIEYALPTGVILTNQDGDKDIIVTSLDLVQNLFDKPGRVTSLDLQVDPSKLSIVQNALLERYGDAFHVKNSLEQNDAAYQVFASEKAVTFILLSLIVLIAAFNTIGVLTMLVLEKRKDISILQSMGADKGLIRRIFFREGLLITWLGLAVGLILGVVFVLLQQHVGLVPIQGSFVDYFPVKLELGDLLGIAVVITVLGIVASIYPSYKSAEA